MSEAERRPPRLAAKCPHCAMRLRVREEDLGANRTCPNCKQVFSIPKPKASQTTSTTSSKSGPRVDDLLSESSTSSDDWTPPTHIGITCHVCKTRYYGTESQIGQALPCPDCHTQNVVPKPVKPKEAKARPDDMHMRGIGFDQGMPSSDPDQFRVTCHVCESILYCLPKHVGKRIRCSDCGTIFHVPQPPPKKSAPSVDLDEGPGFAVRPQAEIPVVKSNADQMLKRASAEYLEREAAKPTPPKRPFVDSVWTMPFQIEVFPILLSIALLGTVIIYLADFSLRTEGRGQVIGLVVMALVSVATLTQVLLTSNAVMTIATSSSLGLKAIDYPKFDLFAIVYNFILVFTSMALSYGPGVSLGLMVGLPWVGLIAFPVAFCLFPFILLSMLDASSAAVPYTQFVAGTLTSNRRDWLRFYLMAFPAYLVALVPHGVAIAIQLRHRGPLNETSIQIHVFALAALVSTYGVMVYFRLLGRLAWVIDQSARTEDDEQSIDTTSEVDDAGVRFEDCIEKV